MCPILEVDYDFSVKTNCLPEFKRNLSTKLLHDKNAVPYFLSALEPATQVSKNNGGVVVKFKQAHLWLSSFDVWD